MTRKVCPDLAWLIVVLCATRLSFSSPIEPRFDPGRFSAVDTRSLLGSPDPLPPLEVVKVFSNLTFERPVALTSARDGSGRLFVNDQIGVIYVFPDENDVKEKTVFLDIREKILGEHFEEGLLGLAFHPRYKENGEFFVYYSTKPRASIVARYKVSTADPNRADPQSEERLLVIPQPFGNHNGGSIEFGPDGLLYVGLGDGGKRDDPHGNGQNVQTLLGSILRIDVDRRDEGKSYAVPPDNPLAGDNGLAYGENVKGEIYAYGVRNAWRLTFDRLTGEGWWADVGQDNWEEVNLLRAGANYGWKVREGTHPWKDKAPRIGDEFVEPILEYPRHEGKSITGGVVYRGSELPELYGAYLYGDFVTFNLWALRYDGKKVTSNHLIARSQLPITAFGEAESGEVYFTSFEAPEGKDTRKMSTGQVFWLKRGGIYKFRRRESGDVNTADFPRRLSETGLFTDLPSMTPAPGLIPYDVNVPLWSDGAVKERYVALPASGQIEFDEKGHWKFPIGTTFVKTFKLAGGGHSHRLETRLLVHSERGWDGYTYLWNKELTDARLLDTALTRSYAVASARGETKQEWYFPSRSDCNACHTKTAGFVLGFNTRQLNRAHDYGSRRANQLAVLDGLGVFASKLQKHAHELESYPAWGARDGSPADLARAYLDVNCAVCHAPGGTGLSKADLRYRVPLGSAALVGQEPGQGRLGAPGTKLLTPGSPHSSELFLRVLRRGPGQMPTLASSRVDWEAVRVLGEWIEGLGKE